MSNLKKSKIANFKPKQGLRTSPSLIYLGTPLGCSDCTLEVRPENHKTWTRPGQTLDQKIDLLFIKITHSDLLMIKAEVCL